MKRTNVVIDEKLVNRAKKLSGIRTTREVVDSALREFVRRKAQRGILELAGKIHWEGDLEEMRKAREF